MIRIVFYSNKAKGSSKIWPESWNSIKSNGTMSSCMRLGLDMNAEYSRGKHLLAIAHNKTDNSTHKIA